MSGTTELPPEVDELFSYSDGDGFLDPEDLEEAGFKYREELDDLELWEKNQTQVEYNPADRVIEDYSSVE